MPKAQLTICLLLIYLTNSFFNFSTQTLLLLILVPTVAMISDLIFVKIRKQKLFIPSAAMTSAMIIILLSGPTTPIYVPALAAVAAMFSKNFIRPGRHIFNPAGFGLMISSLVFAIPVAWWGPGNILALSTKFMPIFLVLLVPFLVSGVRMKRHYTIAFTFASYILSFLVFLILSGNPISKDLIASLILDPTLIFFALVMAPEPMTTPYSGKNQILFGIFLGALAVFSSNFIYQIPILKNLDPLILALLIGNALFFRRR